ncbi:MAG: hypothetical protein PS018_11485 [bacterium]|nr:hypothetical protein [bacterium]
MMDYGFAALCISGALFAFNVFDRVWGGGNRAATSQADMKRYVDVEVAQLRKDVFLRHDTSEGNIGTAVQAIKDMMHKQELEALTARAVAAETYMRRDSYYASMGDLKTDVNAQFDKLDTRLARMEHAILTNAST